MSTTGDGAIAERRQFVRIMDAVGFEYSVLKGDEIEVYSGVERRSRVRVVNKYDIEGYADVKRDYSDVADYIARLEERIRQLVLVGGPSAEAPTHQVSLSAGGMAFADDQLLIPGARIGIQLTLFPEMFRIVCKGKLVAVNDASVHATDNQHYYHVEFYGIAVEDQKRIDEHVTAIRRSTRSDVRSLDSTEVNP